MKKTIYGLMLLGTTLCANQFFVGVGGSISQVTVKETSSIQDEGTGDTQGLTLYGGMIINDNHKIKLGLVSHDFDKTNSFMDECFIKYHYMLDNYQYGRITPFVGTSYQLTNYTVQSESAGYKYDFDQQLLALELGFDVKLSNNSFLSFLYNNSLVNISGKADVTYNGNNYEFGIDKHSQWIASYEYRF